MLVPDDAADTLTTVVEGAVAWAVETPAALAAPVRRVVFVAAAAPCPVDTAENW